MTERANACCAQCQAGFIAVNPSRPPKFCPPCQRDKTNEQKRHQYATQGRADRRNRTKKTVPAWDDEVAALCWCGENTVGVPLDVIRACQTRSCGAPGCGPELLTKGR